MFLCGIPFISVLIYALLAMRAAVHERMWTLYVISGGMAVFLAGALGIEIISNNFEHGSAGYIASVCCEEFCEMSGISIVFSAFYALAVHESATCAHSHIATPLEDLLGLYSDIDK